MFFPRLLPAAVTPIKLEMIMNAWFKEKAKDTSFNDKISHYFGAIETYTFTSLMRTVYASLFPLKRAYGRKYVILPRYSCPSFAHGVLANQLEIRYVDQDPNTLSYDMEDLKKKMDKDVLAIIVPHFFGLAHPIDEICHVSKKVSCVVIESVDYSIGAVYKGKRLGTYGDVGILNFQEGKAIPIGGGALFVRRKGLIQHYMQFKDSYRPFGKSTILRSCAFSCATRPYMYFFVRRIFSLLNKEIKKVSFEDTIRSTHGEFDYNFDASLPLLSISPFAKSLGIEVLNLMAKHQKYRNENASRLAHMLKGVEGIRLIPVPPELDMPHYIRYPIFVKKDVRSRYIKELYEHGIEASSMYTDHGMDIDSHKFPGARKIYDTLLTLPVHPYCHQKDFDSIKCILSSQM